MNGLIVQWGTIENSGAKQFSIEFSVAPFLICNPSANSGAGVLYTNIGHSVTRNQFTYNSAGVASGRWFAIGY